MTALGLAIAIALPLLQGHAAEAAPASSSASEKEARELFQKAEISFNLGKFQDALADYQAAYQAKPLPPFLFNIAQCYRNMQSYERARFFFRRYLALDPHTTNRRLVDNLIAEMTREMDKSDDHAAAAAPVAVAASAPIPAPPPAPAPTPPPVPALALESHAPPAAEPRPIYKRWWFWAGTGAVVTAAVVVGFLVLRADSPQGSLGTIDGR